MTDHLSVVTFSETAEGFAVHTNFIPCPKIEGITLEEAISRAEEEIVKKLTNCELLPPESGQLVDLNDGCWPGKAVVSTSPFTCTITPNSPAPYNDEFKRSHPKLYHAIWSYLYSQ